MINVQDDLLKDIEAVQKISMVPTMLEVICELTGMGFAAVARVTNSRWIACSVRDEVQFGLKEGGELPIATTICNEIRDNCKPIIIDHVDKDSHFRDHHTPKIYGLQSYISFPIILKNGMFFGTLCAIDSRPAKLNNAKIIGIFSMFSELLSFHLQSQDILERAYIANLELANKNKKLADINFDLDNFVYTASHDLKAPISNIKGLMDLLARNINSQSFDREKIIQIIGMMQSSLDRFMKNIKELTTIVEIDKNISNEKSEVINLGEIIENVKKDLHNLISASNAQIEVFCEEKLHIHFSKNNFKSLIYNLLSNAIKYQSPHRDPEILIKVEKVHEKIQLSIKDNGLGIPDKDKEKILNISSRLHNHVEGSGVGLYIVKRIVNKINGKIYIDSAVGTGSTFRIIF